MSRTKEQVYREQMKALGIYQEIHEPEIKTLAKIERQITRAEKAWSATASPPGSAPSFLDPHFAIIQKLRAEALQHREALGITVKALRKLTGAAGTDAQDQKDLITSKLDRIAAQVAAYDELPIAAEADPTGERLNAFLAAGVDPGAQGGLVTADEYDLTAAVAEDMG